MFVPRPQSQFVVRKRGIPDNVTNPVYKDLCRFRLNQYRERYVTLAETEFSPRHIGPIPPEFFRDFGPETEEITEEITESESESEDYSDISSDFSVCANTDTSDTSDELSVSSEEFWLQNYNHKLNQPQFQLSASRQSLNRQLRPAKSTVSAFSASMPLLQTKNSQLHLIDSSAFTTFPLPPPSHQQSSAESPAPRFLPRILKTRFSVPQIRKTGTEPRISDDYLAITMMQAREDTKSGFVDTESAVKSNNNCVLCNCPLLRTKFLCNVCFGELRGEAALRLTANREHRCSQRGSAEVLREILRRESGVRGVRSVARLSIYGSNSNPVAQLRDLWRKVKVAVLPNSDSDVTQQAQVAQQCEDVDLNEHVSFTEYSE